MDISLSQRADNSEYYLYLVDTDKHIKSGVADPEVLLTGAEKRENPAAPSMK